MVKDNLFHIVKHDLEYYILLFNNVITFHDNNGHPCWAIMDTTS